MEVIFMTREQILKLFPDATDDQITNLLNQSNGELAKEKEKTKVYKADAEKAADLQKRIDELEAGNLSEVEKVNKALEEANKTIADLQKNNAIRDQREAAMTNFKITAEQAKAVVKDDGSLDYAELGKIMSDKETAAAQAKEKEIAGNQDNPNGGGAGGDKKTDAEKTAEAIGKTLSGSNKAAESIVESYLK
jgi:hypothetical protein